MSANTDLIKPSQTDLIGRSVQETVNIIEEMKILLKRVMIEDVHYMELEGKKILKKAGADLICMKLGIYPQYEVDVMPHESMHREYNVRCVLFYIPHNTSQPVIVGQGEGLCTTYESKFRYRYENVNTRVPVPGQYWEAKKQDDKKKMQLLMNGGFPKKTSEGWFIHKRGEKSENPDIADVWNTVKKIACKRAYMMAVQTLSACDDLFNSKDDDDEPKPNNNETKDETIGGPGIDVFALNREQLENPGFLTEIVDKFTDPKLLVKWSKEYEFEISMLGNDADILRAKIKLKHNQLKGTQS